MQKKFYCVFGTHLPFDEVTEIFKSMFDMEFVLHDSSYVGQYAKYSGLYADKLTIENNNVDDLSQDRKEKYGEYPVLIRFSNISGRNAEKQSKTKYLKTQIGKIPSTVLLDEKVVEEVSS